MCVWRTAVWILIAIRPSAPSLRSRALQIKQQLLARVDRRLLEGAAAAAGRLPLDVAQQRCLLNTASACPAQNVYIAKMRRLTAAVDDSL